MAAGIFLLMVLWFEGGRGRELWSRAIAYCRVAIPVYIFFGLVERFYSWYRFGSWTQTYIPIFALESRMQDPSLPANFPWSTPLHEGILGALFKPEKSIFLFDPLLILALLMFAIAMEAHDTRGPRLRMSALLLLVGYICFYARYTYWAGDFAWGDRYVSTAVEMVALLSFPCSCATRQNWLPGRAQPPSSSLPASLRIQIASLMFWLPLEIYQMETLGHPTFVIALRFKNIVAFALGNMAAWGLDTEAMHEDAWDYVHITTWNFFPFLLRRVGAAPVWVVDTAFAVWGLALATLAAVLVQLRRVLTIPLGR